MTHITIISGSTLGTAEYVAEHLAEKLEEKKISVETIHGPDLIDLPKKGVWLIVTSTHGAGDLPENLQDLFDQITDQKPDLSNVAFGAIGLGNRSYDTFCYAIDLISKKLQSCHAKKQGNTLKIDVLKNELPEDPAQEWLNGWISLINNE